MQRQQQADRQTSRLTFSLQYLPTRISGAEYLHEATKQGDETCNRSCTPSWWADVSSVMATQVPLFQSIFSRAKTLGLVGYKLSKPGQSNDHLDLVRYSCGQARWQDHVCAW